ncbi:MAG TPA: hypothetical protein VIX59_01900 [Candidatus Binataceae bacterium]
MYRSKHKVAFAAMLALALALQGCVSNAGWNYTPNPPQLAPMQVPVNLAVEQFQDQRGKENSTYRWLCLIPLVPYCEANYDRPDTANGFLTASSYNFRAGADLADATATELRQTNLFPHVSVISVGADPGQQLLLRGAVMNTEWHGTVYSYMLGPYGGLLWIFGLPVGAVHNTLKLKLELVDPASGRVLWSDDVNQDYAKTVGYYYNFGQDFGYPQMFSDGIRSAVASLETYVSSQPPGMWLQLEHSPRAIGAPASRE